MKSIFNWLLYASLAFLLVALYKSNYLLIPDVYSIPVLILAICAVFLSFMLFSYRFQMLLKAGNLPVSFRNALCAIGLTVFGKYIPGKVATVLGPASFVSEKYGYSLKDVSAATLQNQLIGLWSGLILGSLAFLMKGGTAMTWGWFIVLGWSLLTLAIFTPYVHDAATWLLSRLLRKSIRIPQIRVGSVLRVLHLYFIDWIVRCIGFSFLVSSITDHEFSISTGLGFAFAQSFSMFVLVVPGGIGLREGLLVAFLVQSGFDVQQATAVSIASRAWFLAGEFMIFSLGASLVLRGRRSSLVCGRSEPK